MTAAPVSIEGGASLDDAIQLMDRHGVRHLPVTELGKCVGLLTDRDLLTATGWLPARVRDMYQGPETVRSTLVRDLVREPAMSVAPDDKLVSISVEAVVQGTGCLPVLEHDELVGIVSEIDLLRAYSEHCTRLADSSSTPPISRYMSPHPETIEIHATVEEAEELCKRAGIRHLPVLRSGAFVGILSDRDLRRALGRAKGGTRPIDDFVTLDPIAAEPEQPISLAARLMVEHHISALPIVDTDGDLVGILSAVDLLEPCAAALDFHSA